MSDYYPTEQYQQDQILGWKTSTAVTKGLAAVLVAGNEVAVASEAGGPSIGVIMDSDDAAGAYVGVLCGPARKVVIAGAAFSDAAYLANDSGGKFVTATSSDIVLAQALGASGGANAEVLVFLFAPGQNTFAEMS